MEHATELTRAELAALLLRERFRPDCYRLHGGLGAGECYVLDHTPAGWEVYYSERGMKGSLRVFGTEGDACTHLLGLLRRDPLTRQD